jgi:hypothetical protein
MFSCAEHVNVDVPEQISLGFQNYLKMAAEEMAAVLRAPNQLCYYVFFFTLFVTYFVHNVSTTVSYGKKELLDIRTAIIHLRLDKDFFYNRRTHRTFSKHPTGPTSLLFARGSDTGTEDKEPDAWSGPGEGEWESVRYRQYYSPTCSHWTIN